MSPRQNSLYAVSYEEPAPAPNAQSGGLLYNVLNELVVDAKGEWAKIVECNSRSGANSILNRINKGGVNLPAPREQFQFTCRTDGESGKSWLFAVFSADGFGEAEVVKPARKRAPRKAKAAVETAAE